MPTAAGKPSITDMGKETKSSSFTVV